MREELALGTSAVKAARRIKKALTVSKCLPLETSIGRYGTTTSEKLVELVRDPEVPVTVML